MEGVLLSGVTVTELNDDFLKLCWDRQLEYL